MKGHLDKISKLDKRVTTLSIWDIDDTLFVSENIRIYVVAKNSVVKKLTTQEFNKYRLRPGERYDFSEFRNAKLFFHGATPLNSNITKAKKILESNQSMLLVLTARANFDNKNMFLKKFQKYGLDLDTAESHVARAGNLGISSTAQAKKTVIEECLNTEKFTEVHMYDDDPRNLSAFLSLIPQYENIKFKAYIAKDNKLIKYR